MILFASFFSVNSNLKVNEKIFQLVEKKEMAWSPYLCCFNINYSYLSMKITYNVCHAQSVNILICRWEINKQKNVNYNNQRQHCTYPVCGWNSPTNIRRFQIFTGDQIIQTTFTTIKEPKQQQYNFHGLISGLCIAFSFFFSLIRRVRRFLFRNRKLNDD